MTSRSLRPGLWLRMAIGSLVLAGVTSALVVFETLVIGVLVYGTFAYAYQGTAMLGSPGPLAVTLAVIVVATVAAVGRVVSRAIHEAADDAADLEGLHREKLRALLLASMGVLMLLADAVSLDPPPIARLLSAVFVLAYVGWWAISELDRGWPPDDDPSGLDARAVGTELGRQVGRLEARAAAAGPRAIGLRLAALVAGVIALYATTATVSDPQRLFVPLAGASGLAVVAVHHVRVALAELDDAAALRELRSDLGPWVERGEFDEDAPETLESLERRLRRLAVQADVPTPALRVATTRTPTAAAIGYRPATSTIVLSRGLLETVDERELEAVLAHELAHVANRDAAVVTLLSFPGAAARATIDRQARNPIAALFAHLVIATSRLSAATVARAREYAADDGAVVVTDDPAALASALEALDANVRRRPDRDLRGTATAFSIVPPPWEERRFFDRPKRFVSRRLLGTHPSTTRRIERLESRARERSSS